MECRTNITGWSIKTTTTTTTINKQQTTTVQLSSVQCSSRWYLCAREGPFSLHPVSQVFPQCCPWDSSNVGLMWDDGRWQQHVNNNTNTNNARTYTDIIILSRLTVIRHHTVHWLNQNWRATTLLGPWATGGKPSKQKINLHYKEQILYCVHWLASDCQHWCTLTTVISWNRLDNIR